MRDYTESDPALQNHRTPDTPAGALLVYFPARAEQVANEPPPQILLAVSTFVLRSIYPRALRQFMKKQMAVN